MKFRFHIYAYDTLRRSREKSSYQRDNIERHEKVWWVRCDLAKYDIRINGAEIFIGLEWIDDRQSREKDAHGSTCVGAWKMEQYRNHNEKVTQVVLKAKGGERLFNTNIMVT